MTRLRVCVSLICTLLNIVAATRIKDIIYMDIDGAAACFRRHNGTHQFGCSSERSGSVGVIHIIQNEADLTWLEHESTAGPYSVVLGFPMFTRDTLVRLRATDNVNGVLLADNITTNAPSVFSPEDTCPNRYSNLANSCSQPNGWNQYGSSLLLEDWPFPMFFLQNETILNDIKSCFEKYNSHSRNTHHERSLCALEMKSFMNAAVNSETCIRRSKSVFNSELFCDPMGDRNVHWPLGPLNDNVESVIMVVARLDAMSMFIDFVPGAQSAIHGLATLMATAFYLNSLNATVEKTNVVFSILNGESMDYIGSSRLVYDLKEGQFQALGGKNLSLDRISAVIELGQLSNHTESGVYLHASQHAEKSDLILKLNEALSGQMMKNSVPPASVQWFLKEKPTLPAVVIASHGIHFDNKFYESMLDDAVRSGFASKPKEVSNMLANVSITLGNVLYKAVTGNDPPKTDTSIVAIRIRQILTCYLISANCDLFEAALPPDTKVSDKIFPLYVSVARVDNPSTFFTSQLLKLLTGTPVSVKNATECYDRHFIWMNGYEKTGLCINSTVNYSPAVSPAFIIEDYDYASGLYSTWTESVWETFSVRMFLKPSAATERLTMILGCSVALVSFVVVWFINSRSSILFNSSRSIDL